MAISVYIISDLHLGGEPASPTTSGFQMCSAQGQARLQKFLRHLCREAKSRAIHLVINGDIVDFLAEAPFLPFTSDNQAATAKLQIVLNNHVGIFDALSEFVATGAQLTLMLGNHDIELSLPGPRRLLLERLGPGRVELIDDNEALAFGRALLIEHGNTYDEWNAVDYTLLRKFRADLSRGAPLKQEFPAMPGSKLVANVMNRIKQNHPYVDLLKPEIHMSISLLLAIDPRMILESSKFIDYQVKARWRKSQAEEGEFISSSGTAQTPDEALISSADLEAMLAQSRETEPNIALRPDIVWEGTPIAGAAAAPKQPAESVGTINYLKAGFKLFGALIARDNEDSYAKKLQSALHEFAAIQRTTYDTTQEDRRYIRPARQAILKGGFKTVVYGHTHLAKVIDLYKTEKPEPQDVRLGTYMNSGTWADLIKIPDRFLNSTGESLDEFKKFLRNISGNELGSWRKLLPTFVRADLEPENAGHGPAVRLADSFELKQCGLFVFDSNSQERPLSEYLAANPL